MRKIPEKPKIQEKINRRNTSPSAGLSGTMGWVIALDTN